MFLTCSAVEFEQVCTPRVAHACVHALPAISSDTSSSTAPQLAGYIALSWLRSRTI